MQPHQLVIARAQSVEFNQINAAILELFDLAQEHDAVYDGWETGVCPAS